MSGKFIVFEGIDGAGTTTQTELLGKALVKNGRDVLQTFEPSSRPVGLLIKQVLQGKIDFDTSRDGLLKKTLALLFGADRLDHLANVVLPAMDAGTHVVSDRYNLSSLAYQSLDAPLEWVCEINRYAIEPDLLIFIEINSDIALDRIKNGRDEQELFEKKDILKKIAANYRKLFDEIPADKKLLIDGTKPIEEIHAESLARVQELLK